MLKKSVKAGMVKYIISRVNDNSSDSVEQLKFQRTYFSERCNRFNDVHRFNAQQKKNFNDNVSINCLS